MNTETEVKATPRPWKAFGRELVFGEDMWAIGELYNDPREGEPEANAALIVEAVNTYDKLKSDRDALLEALGSMDHAMGGMQLLSESNRELVLNAKIKAKAAIAQCENSEVKP